MRCIKSRFGAPTSEGTNSSSGGEKVRTCEAGEKICTPQGNTPGITNETVIYRLHKSPKKKRKEERGKKEEKIKAVVNRHRVATRVK